MRFITFPSKSSISQSRHNCHLPTEIMHGALIHQQSLKLVFSFVMTGFLIVVKNDLYQYKIKIWYKWDVFFPYVHKWFVCLNEQITNGESLILD